MHSDYAQIYMENDILLDLTGYIEKDGVDMSIYYPDIAAIYTREDGKIFALPKDHDTIALLYNKAIFDQAGVAYPTDEWTYDDMYEAASQRRLPMTSTAMLSILPTIRTAGTTTSTPTAEMSSM